VLSTGGCWVGAVHAHTNVPTISGATIFELPNDSIRFMESPFVGSRLVNPIRAGFSETTARRLDHETTSRVNGVPSLFVEHPGNHSLFWE
jgi:hypothetical protein